MAAIPKAELMAARRQRLKDRKFKTVECYVPEGERQRLARYVEERLGGETNVRRDVRSPQRGKE